MTVEAGTKWVGTNPIAVEDYDFSPLPEEVISEYLFDAQVMILWMAEHADVEVDDDSWQIIENLLRCEGVKR